VYFLARKNALIHWQPRGKCREVARSGETYSQNISIEWSCIAKNFCRLLPDALIYSWKTCLA
jgi:hypothetical protein